MPLKFEFESTPQSKCVTGPKPARLNRAQLHESGSNLAVCLRVEAELLGAIVWGTRVGLEPGRFVRLPRDFRGWPILAFRAIESRFLGMAT